MDPFYMIASRKSILFCVINKLRCQFDTPRKIFIKIHKILEPMITNWSLHYTLHSTSERSTQHRSVPLNSYRSVSMKKLLCLSAFTSLVICSIAASAAVPSSVTITNSATIVNGQLQNNFQCTVNSTSPDTVVGVTLQVQQGGIGASHNVSSWSFSGVGTMGVHTFHWPGTGNDFYSALGTTSSGFPNSGSTPFVGPY